MLVWIFVVFLWLYSVPLIFVGLIVLSPAFVFMVFILCMVGVLQYFFNRKKLSKLDYSKWFGKVPKIYLNKKYLVCFHPHGILCTAAVLCIHLNNETKFAVAPILIHLPIIGLFAEKLGCIEATEIAICNALKSHSVILCPGGIPELVTQKLYERRHGFLRIAQKMNVEILPVTCNTKFYYNIYMPFENLRVSIAKLGIPIMFPPLGWYGTWLPKRKDILLDVKDAFVVEGDIEKERQRYFKKLKS